MAGPSIRAWAAKGASYKSQTPQKKAPTNTKRQHKENESSLDGSKHSRAKHNCTKFAKCRTG